MFYCVFLFTCHVHQTKDSLSSITQIALFCCTFWKADHLSKGATKVVWYVMLFCDVFYRFLAMETYLNQLLQVKCAPSAWEFIGKMLFQCTSIASHCHWVPTVQSESISLSPEQVSLVLPVSSEEAWGLLKSHLMDPDLSALFQSFWCRRIVQSYLHYWPVYMMPQSIRYQRYPVSFLIWYSRSVQRNEWNWRLSLNRTSALFIMDIQWVTSKLHLQYLQHIGRPTLYIQVFNVVLCYSDFWDLLYFEKNAIKY